MNSWYRVERWGMRLWRGGLGEYFGAQWREEAERVGFWSGGWNGRVLRSLKEFKLEGERWEVSAEREGKGNWKVGWGKDKLCWKEKWEKWRGEREEEWLVGVSDASERRGMLGVGGGLWEEGKCLLRWNGNGGRGLTVGEGEMGGVEWVLLKVAEEYKGERRKLVVGVDNVGVLRRLEKGRGWCGEREQEVRRLANGLLLRGWELRFEWVPGHVDIVENVEVDKLAREGVWNEERLNWGSVLCWGRWEQRRKRKEFRSWREYWEKERGGEAYFGSGSGGELGLGGLRGEGVFLFWMRTDHGGMGGARYERGDRLCVCGGEESRDHVLLYCERWVEERRRLREVVGDVWGEDGWVDMRELLFGEEGVKGIAEFGRKVGLLKEWKEKRSNWRRGEELRRGRRWRNVGEGGLDLEGRKREVRERTLRLNRLRRKKQYLREKELGRLRGGGAV